MASRAKSPPPRPPQPVFKLPPLVTPEPTRPKTAPARATNKFDFTDTTSSIMMRKLSLTQATTEKQPLGKKIDRPKTAPAQNENEVSKLPPIPVQERELVTRKKISFGDKSLEFCTSDKQDPLSELDDEYCEKIQAVFRSNYAEMIEQINPMDIYHRLYAEDIITKSERDIIFKHAESKKGITELVNAVERSISINTSNFKKFVNILKAERRYTKLVQLLHI